MKKALAIGIAFSMLAMPTVFGETKVNHERTAIAGNFRAQTGSQTTQTTQTTRPKETSGRGMDLTGLEWEEPMPPKAEEKILEQEEIFDLPKTGPLQENPYFREGIFKGIRYCDSVYRIGTRDIILRKQTTKAPSSPARYYSFLIINSEVGASVETLAQGPYFSIIRENIREEVSFPRIWRKLPQGLMTLIQKDTLEQVFSANHVNLLVPDAGGKWEEIPIPAEALALWKRALNHEFTNKNPIIS